MNVDESIYNNVKIELQKLLEQYRYDTIKLKGNIKDDAGNPNIEESRLYIVDAKAIEKLKEFDTLLHMEYQEYDNLQEQNDSKRKKRSVADRYSLESMVKVINFHAPANSYGTTIQESWKQINDEEKVRESLEVELIKHKRKLEKNIRKKMDVKNLTPGLRADIMSRVEAEAKEEAKEYQYILEHFEELDVRISTYYERIETVYLNWYVEKERQSNVSLRKTVPNVIWFEELNEEDKKRSDNKIEKYFKHAKRAYGNVFYAPKSKEYAAKINEEKGT